MILESSDYMAKKKTETQEIIEKISNYSLSEIMESGFGRYSKEIIQERALPDVRDGLKPVQRRILFAMKKAGYTCNKPYQKSAKAVGYIMGNFHPHGDSSIYDALIRMSQKWKMRETFVDIHGNNGSIDGDGPAAMRYTEARLSKIAETMLESIDKDTVEMAYNFDDTELEPTVLPARFPNLLVNGSTGISAGYATDIPTHNLGEVIDATVKRIDSPNCTLETIMSIVEGPDFPTGGVIEGKNDLLNAYRTGKGKVVLKADAEIDSQHNQIIINSIPYEVVKENLVRKINEIKIDKKIEGIVDVIDESDHENMARIIIQLKKDSNASLILNYLYKNTDLQVNYNFNMVAIVNRRPKQVGILDILDAFIAHQKSVVRRRTEFDLKKARNDLHILEGLVKAISILDDVIRVIRASKNKSDSIDNLVKEFSFTFEQAKAIVELQLYRLTNTDILELQAKMDELKKNIMIWEQILSNEDALKHVMKTELKLIKKEYGNPRRTKIKEEVTEIKIDMKDMIPKENVVVVLTNEGYIRRVSMKSFQGATDAPTLKPGDYITHEVSATTLDHFVVFTNLGNYLFLPVHKIFDTKWKDLGKHVNNLVPLQSEEKVVDAYLYNPREEVTMATKLGMIKRCKMQDFEASRVSKAMTAMKLKENDEVVSVTLTKNNILTVSENGYYCYFESSQVPVVGARGAGVKAMNLKDDILKNMISFDECEYITLFTNKNTGKRIKVSDLTVTGRAKKGNTLIKKVKSTNYLIEKVLGTDSKTILSFIMEDRIIPVKNSEIPIFDLASTGSLLTKKNVVDIIYEVTLQTKEEKVPTEEQVAFNLDDFKI